MQTTGETTTITVHTTVNAAIEKAWKCWTEPNHIIQWAFASDDWHTPYAENDLKVDGKFKTRMAAKDGSFGFDFEGVYTKVQEYKLIEYILGDRRKVSISFNALGNQTKIVETFDPEKENSPEMQKAGWQAIMDNYKKHTEATE